MMGSGSAEIQDDGAEARRYDGNGAGKAPRLRPYGSKPADYSAAHIANLLGIE
jgi:hypothetical protein